ncbi:MAG: hypothetical protein KDK38_05935 [Leptospiraceae bacterium]|nr:hypothetical protein [Leptospiraceae bacterium]
MRKIIYYILRIPLRWKFFIRLTAIVFIPLIISNYFFLQRQKKEAEYSAYEKQLLKLKLFGTEVEKIFNAESKLKPVIYPEIANLPLSTQLKNRIHQYSASQTEDKTDYYLIFHERESLNLAKVTIGQSIEYTTIPAEDLENLVLNSTNISADETLLLYTSDGEPVFSNILEVNFKVPLLWQKTILNSEQRISPFDSVKRIRLQEKELLIVQSRLSALGFIAVLATPAEIVFAGIQEQIQEQLVLSATILLLVLLMAFLLSRNELQFFQALKETTQALQKADFSKRLKNTFLDERREISRSINQLRTRLQKNHAVNLDELLQSRTRINLILDLIEEAVIIFDKKYNVSDSNARFKTLITTAFQRENFSSNIEAFFKKMFPEQPWNSTDSVDFCWIHQPNSRKEVKFYRVSARKVTFSNALGDYTMMIFSDITTSVMSEKNLTRASRITVESNRQKSDFLKRLENDIYPPVGKIKNQIEEILTAANHEQILKTAHEIHASTELLQFMLRDILELTNLEAGKLLIQRQPFSFSEMIHELNNAAVSIMTGSQSRLELTLDSKIPDSLIGDKETVINVLLKVLQNLYFLTDRGRLKIEIQLVNISASFCEILFQIQTVDPVREESLKKLNNQFNMSLTAIEQIIDLMGASMEKSKSGIVSLKIKFTLIG